MGTFRIAIAGIGLLVYIGILSGCAEVVVPGAFAGSGEYYRYTTSNVAQKTMMGNVGQVTEASRKALKRMNIRFDSMETDGSETDINAATPELDITISMKPITATATRVSVNAVKDHVIKDKATAAEILSQIQVELDHERSPDKGYSKVFIKSDCRHPIDVVVYYLAGKNEPETWQTRGWFSLASGQKKHVADTHNRYVYFYGKTRGENKRTWTGEILQWFEGERYGFFRVDMGATLTDYTQVFSCD